MWVCKECGGEILAVGEINTEAEFEMDKNGNVVRMSDGSSLETLVKNEVWVWSHYCRKCRTCITEELTETEEAEWVDE